MLRRDKDQVEQIISAIERIEDYNKDVTSAQYLYGHNQCVAAFTRGRNSPYVFYPRLI